MCSFERTVIFGDSPQKSKINCQQKERPSVGMLAKQLNNEIKFPGDNSGEATPVPIPNTVVKLSSADGTADSVGE